MPDLALPDMNGYDVLATANPRTTVFYKAFDQRLRELGYVEGQNVSFEYVPTIVAKIKYLRHGHASMNVRGSYAYRYAPTPPQRRDLTGELR